MDFKDAVELVGKTIDAIGVLVVAAGIVYVTLTCFLRRRDEGDTYRAYRQGLGRVILLGLEFLVAGDIVRTVAVSPTFRTAGVLAIIVLVRTLLSFTLQLEIEGRLPWRRRDPASPTGAG